MNRRYRPRAADYLGLRNPATAKLEARSMEARDGLGKQMHHNQGNGDFIGHTDSVNETPVTYAHPARYERTSLWGPEPEITTSAVVPERVKVESFLEWDENKEISVNPVRDLPIYAQSSLQIGVDAPVMEPVIIKREDPEPKEVPLPYVWGVDNVSDYSTPFKASRN